MRFTALFLVPRPSPTPDPGTTKTHFDDREEVVKALRQRPC